MSKKEIRSISEKVEIREKDDEKKIAGYAAVYYDGNPENEYNIFDNVYERIAPGAFDAAINRDDVRGLFNHNPENILGRTKSGTMRLSADSKGLKYEIDLPDTSLAKDVAVSLSRGDVSGSSFAFLPTKVSWQDGENREIRTIEEVELFDVGPVTYPAYDGTSSYARNTDNAEKELNEIKEKKEAEGLKDFDYADSCLKTIDFKKNSK